LLLPQLSGIARGPRLLLAMLARRVAAAFHRAFVGEALLPLQKQLLAFTPALPALCVEIPGHMRRLPSSDASLLGRTATVVRDRGHVRNTGDLEPDVVERPDRRFTARSRAFDPH